MSKICLYHGDDLDGICSAAIVKHKHPDVRLYPVSYDKLIDYDSIITEGDDVIIVDYVLQPFDHMVKINDMCNLTWIDHHDTSMCDYDQYIKIDGSKKIAGSRSLDKSACELTWEYMFPDIDIPYSVWLLGRYDIWQYKESQSVMPFQYGMKLGYKEPESNFFWSRVFNEKRDDDFIQDIIKNGKIIIKYRTKLNEKLCNVQSFESTLLNHKCICINRALCGSTVFDSLWDNKKYDMMVVFYICRYGAWNVSLYTDRDDIHVGNIAKEYGGGGHAGAAGFRCTLLPFEIVC